MKQNEEASLSILKILCVSLIFIFVLGITVMAVNQNLGNVTVILSNKYETSILTSKTKVEEILKENNIIVLPDEKVVPGLEEEIDETKTIIITKNDDEVRKIEIGEEKELLSTEELLKNYDTIIEKIVIVNEEIPFETITKDVSNDSTNTINKVIQAGENGLREVTYKIKYQNDIEIEKTQIDSKIIKEPKDKIVQIQTNKTTSRSSGTTARTNPATTSGSSLAKKVEGITPKVATLNASAYTESTCGKSPSSPGYGITASGARVTSWQTVAAGRGYAIGTVIYIPYFANKPNEGWFVVQDRGGAISNNKIDIYMTTYNECISFGRRNLECYIYEI